MNINIDKEKDNKLTTEDFDSDYVLIYKDVDNILDDIGFEGDDRIICKSIINSLEHEAAINIREEKCVSIPNIGTIQKNKYKSKLISHYKEFKKKRGELTREEYNEYTRQVMSKEKELMQQEENEKKAYLKFKKKMMPKWMELYQTKGIIYANAWLHCFRLLEVVEFDEEIEEVYERFGY